MTAAALLAQAAAGMRVYQNPITGLNLYDISARFDDLAGELVSKDCANLGWMSRRHLENVEIGSTNPDSGYLYQHIGSRAQPRLGPILELKLPLAFKNCS
jgi:hypothetical protein